MTLASDMTLTRFDSERFDQPGREKALKGLGCERVLLSSLSTITQTGATVFIVNYNMKGLSLSSSLSSIT